MEPDTKWSHEDDRNLEWVDIQSNFFDHTVTCYYSLFLSVSQDKILVFLMNVD